METSLGLGPSCKNRLLFSFPFYVLTSDREEIKKEVEERGGDGDSSQFPVIWEKGEGGGMM